MEEVEVDRCLKQTQDFYSGGQSLCPHVTPKGYIYIVILRATKHYVCHLSCHVTQKVCRKLGIRL